jgi:hypothetical protein
MRLNTFFAFVLCGCQLFKDASPTEKWANNRLFEYCVSLEVEKNMPIYKKMDCWIKWIKISKKKATKHQLSYAYKRIIDLSKQIN